MTTKPTQQNQACVNQASLQQFKVIALRKYCEADGIGLSHYILLDRKAAK